jgi:hypothetical protein
MQLRVLFEDDLNPVAPKAQSKVPKPETRNPKPETRNPKPETA